MHLTIRWKDISDIMVLGISSRPGCVCSGEVLLVGRAKSEVVEGQRPCL